MDPKQREIVQRLVADGIVRPPTITQRAGIEIRVDNSLPNNVWLMNNQSRQDFLRFLWHQKTIAERMKRKRLIEKKGKDLQILS